MDTPTELADPLIGRLLDGRYRLDRVLDRGGMATVYTAEDARLDRTVAVKVMHRALADDPAFVEPFAQEARAAARLQVPEVVQVLDQGRDAATGLAYLVMELVRGRNLRQLLRSSGALSAGRALEVMEPVLRALAAAHAAGLVHRDVKPENVLLGDDGRVKVADFGLARAVQRSTITTTLTGTAAYLAPEQTQGQPATERSDVYAAGVLLWELLTGTPPYDGETYAAVAYRHVHEDVPPPGTVVEGVPPELDRLVVEATRRDPALRPADAGVFLAELLAVRRALPLDEDSPVVRRSDEHRTRVVPVLPPVSPGAPDPVARRRRPRRGVVVAALVALAVLLVSGTGWYLGSGRWTTAPGVLGMTQAQAVQRLTASGLSAKVDPSRFDEAVPAGRVLEQHPGPRGRVRKDGTVTLVLSKGPDRRAVPALAGSTEPAARAQLAEAGLVAGRTTRVFSPTVPSGSVVKTDPAAGQRLKPGSSVALVVSKGVELLPVPDQQGKPVAAAVAALKAAGFTAQVTEAFNDTVPKGAVADQSPSQGTAARGSAVQLVVSKGPEMVVVPSLGGRSVADARGQLAALGLKDRVIAIPGGPGTVRDQSPSGGASVRKGTVVTLYVF